MKFEETLCKECSHQQDKYCYMEDEDVSKGLFGTDAGCNQYESQCPKCDGLLKTHQLDEDGEHWQLECSKCEYKLKWS